MKTKDYNLTGNREGAIACQEFDRTYQVVYPIVPKGTTTTQP